MYLDVRPAVDSLGAVFDRMYMGLLKTFLPTMISGEYIPGGKSIVDGVLAFFKLGSLLDGAKASTQGSQPSGLLTQAANAAEALADEDEADDHKNKRQ
jgi:hypothetical protein